MTAREGYKRAEEFLKQGHSHLCAAVMARGDDCLCRMEGKEGNAEYLMETDFKELVLQKEKEGKIVFMTWDGPREVDLDHFIEQPTKGLLYDLNRDRATVLTFINEKPEKWINDFACGLVIERLKKHYDERRNKKENG